MIGIITTLAISLTPPVDAQEIVERIESARADISEADKRQRETLSHLFVLNKKIKEMVKTRTKLNTRLMQAESRVRIVAQEVGDLEERSRRQQSLLNSRLRHLYQNRKVSSYQWLFSAQSPLELERNHRFMRKMVDSDHQRLKSYVSQLRQLHSKRRELKRLVGGLARTQNEVQSQEAALQAQLNRKARFVKELKRTKDLKLSELKELREQGAIDSLSYAFFEKKGRLRSPVQAEVVREYGTYVDKKFRFQLMHKGFFYRSEGLPVSSVAEGKVVLATKLPGYGKTVIISHGDNYYTVYALNRKLQVGAGDTVREGQLVAVSGDSSPLFGPGLYFEIRHFTDAIDPAKWIKEPVIKTAGF